MVNRFILALRSSKAKFTGANGATETDAVSAIMSELIDLEVSWLMDRDLDLFVYLCAGDDFDRDRVYVMPREYSPK